MKTPNKPDIKTTDTQGVVTGPGQQGAAKDHDRHEEGVRRGRQREKKKKRIGFPDNSI